MRTTRCRSSTSSLTSSTEGVRSLPIRRCWYGFRICCRTPNAASWRRYSAALIERYSQTLETDRRFLLESYRFADVARKVVGVGSVGTRCWIILLLGKDDEDPLFLQAKEADESVLAPYVGGSTFATQGERVVAYQRLMQATSDIFLGWERLQGMDGKQRDFYLRQLRDWKGIAVAERMSPKRMALFGRLRAVPRWPAPTPGPETGSQSPPTWAAATPSTGRW